MHMTFSIAVKHIWKVEIKSYLLKIELRESSRKTITFHSIIVFTLMKWTFQVIYCFVCGTHTILFCLFLFFVFIYFDLVFCFFVDFVNWIRIFVKLLNTDILNGSNACKFGCLSREMFLTSTLYDFGIHDLSPERIWRENFLSKIKRERHFWRLIKIEWQRKSNS